jgi:hypothetical protein
MSTGNRCQCPSPPGGEVTCAPDQAAVCYVDEAGALHALCIALPAQARAPHGDAVGDAQLAAWADVIGARLDVDAAQLLPPLRAHRAAAISSPLALTLRRRGGAGLRIRVRLP